MWITPVVDRTKLDVDNRTPKGFINYTDLNRIESNCQFIADALMQLGQPVSITTKTDWTKEDIPYLEELERIRQNVIDIANAFHVLQTTPDPPDDMDQILFGDMNDIEKILLDVKTLIDNMISLYRICGTFYSGEDGELY